MGVCRVVLWHGHPAYGRAMQQTAFSICLRIRMGSISSPECDTRRVDFRKKGDIFVHGHAEQRNWNPPATQVPILNVVCAASLMRISLTFPLTGSTRSASLTTIEMRWAYSTWRLSIGLQAKAGLKICATQKIGGSYFRSLGPPLIFFLWCHRGEVQ